MPNRRLKEDKLLTNRQTVNRLLRYDFEQCNICPPNRGENALGKRREKRDKYKNKNRESIRKISLDSEIESELY